MTMTHPGRTSTAKDLAKTGNRRATPQAAFANHRTGDPLPTPCKRHPITSEHYQGLGGSVQGLALQGLGLASFSCSFFWCLPYDF